nr:MAG TPA: restriction enzyme [Herelleviridae sp.]
MKPYKYKLGEIVNDSLIIIRQTRGELRTNRNEKEYEVQSLYYRDAPTYLITEYSLVKGTQCAYTFGSRVYEGNSLYNEDWVKPYLVDIEEAKTLKPYSNKLVTFKCPSCSHEKKMKPIAIKTQGFFCPYCSNHISYPELFFISYLEVKNIQYEYQFKFKDLPNRKFDFKLDNLIVETHGEQHFKETKLYKGAKDSDKEKREYCKTNNIQLLELDCSKSEFNFIKNSINQSILPSINKEEEKLILERINQNKYYNTNNIIELYNKGVSTKEIARIEHISKGTVLGILKKHGIDTSHYTLSKKDYNLYYPVEDIKQMYQKEKNITEVAKAFNISRQTITRILEREDIKIQSKGKRVRCINTGELFNSITEASKHVGVSYKALSKCMIKGKGYSCGKKGNDRLYWEYAVD